MAQMHCTQAGEAGRPGDRPDVRGFTEIRMSGLAGRMSGLTELVMVLVTVLYGMACPDFWGRGRISGCWRGAGCPGLRPDVRGL